MPKTIIVTGASRGMAIQNLTARAKESPRDANDNLDYPQALA